MFGCDVCQDVCPYNQSARQDAAFEAFAPGGRWNELEASDLLRMDESRFSAWAQGSALKRAKREGLARNIALVLGNRGEARHLPLLDEARIGDASEVVREAAAWAYQQLSRRLGVEE
jgi:epoxyqueuosine reductase